MVSRIIAIPILAAAVIAPVFADDFEIADLDDGKWEFSRGSPNCPVEIKIDTEEPAISAAVLESEAKDGTRSKCTGAGKIDLVRSANDGNAFQKAIVNNKDSSPVYGGAQKGALKCSALDIPANTFWLFFSPDDEFKVNPSKTLPGGINEVLAANSGNDVEFEEDKEYLVLGNLCVYKQESRGEGLVESAGDKIDDVKNSVCFPAHATVEVRDGSVKKMEDVQIGDEVKVGPATFSPVFMFTHKMADTTNAFVSLTAASGAQVDLTPGHYIYANDALVTASTVSVGDVLRLGDGTYSAVEKVSTAQYAGLYNPQTVSGDVVVNGVISSTYTTAVEPTFAHAILAPLRALSRAVGFKTTALESGGGALTGLAPRGKAAV